MKMRMELKIEWTMNNEQWTMKNEDEDEVKDENEH